MRPQEREILEAEHENAEALAQRESELEKLRQSERLCFLYVLSLLLCPFCILRSSVFGYSRPVRVHARFCVCVCCFMCAQE